MFTLPYTFGWFFFYLSLSEIGSLFRMLWCLFQSEISDYIHIFIYLHSHALYKLNNFQLIHTIAIQELTNFILPNIKLRNITWGIILVVIRHIVRSLVVVIVRSLILVIVISLVDVNLRSLVVRIVRFLVVIILRFLVVIILRSMVVIILRSLVVIGSFTPGTSGKKKIKKMCIIQGSRNLKLRGKSNKHQFVIMYNNILIIINYIIPTSIIQSLHIKESRYTNIIS